jgi:hypothetical protein
MATPPLSDEELQKAVAADEILSNDGDLDALGQKIVGILIRADGPVGHAA